MTNLATIVLLGGRPSRAQSPLTPCDINGDGVLDVSDPVALLGYIFEGESIACAQNPQLTGEELTLLREIIPHLSIESLDDGQAAPLTRSDAA